MPKCSAKSVGMTSAIFIMCFVSFTFAQKRGDFKVVQALIVLEK